MIPLTTELIDDGYLNTRFKHYVQKSKLLKVEYTDKRGMKRYNFHFHCLRHSYATFRLERGDNPQNVMNEMGHNDYETLQLYSHISLESRQRATNKVYGYGRELPNIISVPRIESDDKAYNYEEAQLELKRRELEIKSKELELKKIELMRKN